jgi:pantoate--beta-alanine ligase
VITVTTIAEVREWRRATRTSVGLVPTMGYLHEGHLSLLRRARAENERVCASIFVNPTQFGPHEDLARYPRDLARDAELLRAHGCDLVLAPPVQEVYPVGFDTGVEVGGVSVPLEGERRPGHFRGVATIVLKLFAIFEPTRAYFGQKDAQQLAVVGKMTRDLNLPVELVPCTTVRDSDGLALSSRNSYLKPEERRAAPVLHRALSEGQRLFAEGVRNAEILRAAMRVVIEREPLARIDYVSVVDPLTFQEIPADINGPAVLLLAVYLGATRLIDNLQVLSSPS